MEKKLKKRAVKHLKGDIRGYHHEIKEDQELIKALKKKPAAKKKVVRRKKK